MDGFRTNTNLLPCLSRTNQGKHSDSGYEKAGSLASCSTGKDNLRTETILLSGHGSQTIHVKNSDSGHAEACTSASVSCNLISQFIGMGFPKKTVQKAIQENGESNMDLILEFLLKHSAVDKTSSECDNVPYGFSHPSTTDSWFQSEEEVEHLPEKERKLLHLIDMGFDVDEASNAVDASETDTTMEDLMDFIYANQTTKSFEVPPQGSQRPNSHNDEEDVEHRSEKERQVLQLFDMGFKVDEAANAVDASEPDTTIEDLMDFIYATQTTKSSEVPLQWTHRPVLHNDESVAFKRGRASDGEERWKRKQELWRSAEKASRQKRKMLSVPEADRTNQIPKHMVGFGVPNEPMPKYLRKIPETAIRRPFFYYENVAYTPKGVWGTISRFLFDIQPEFVDSLHFCAAARKRGYVHNLPVQNRFPLKPPLPLTIQEALPWTKQWWPSWDRRTKLNCLNTCTASAQLTKRLRDALEQWEGAPPLKTQNYVLSECRKWNLVWIGKNKLAPLNPDEIEQLLGYPKDHTRGGGISMTDRFKSLGNSFQVDTVAYHLSVLKSIYPSGINVLSLFSGIGGAEVALHRLGIPLKNVVSVEISEVNRNIIRSWWEQTNQKGKLVELEDVQQLSSIKLMELIHSIGGFDLVIGGSPCNNLTGSNRVSRDGLQGQHSVLFYEYFRILDQVHLIMRNL